MTCPNACNSVGGSTYEPVIISIVGSTCFTDYIPTRNDGTEAESFTARIDDIMKQSVHDSGSFGGDYMVCTTSVTVIENDISVMVCDVIESVGFIAITAVAEYLEACGHFLNGDTSMKTAYGKTGFIVAVLFGIEVREVKFLCKEVIACIKTYLFENGNSSCVCREVQRPCYGNVAVIGVIPVGRT